MRFFVVPAVLLAAITLYVAANPSGSAVQELATPEPSPSATTAPIDATPIARDEQLPGLSGRLTYQSRRGLVTVDFPAGAVVDSPAIEPDFGGSDDGIWKENIDCGDDGCAISFFTRDGRVTEIAGRHTVWSSLWQPGAHAIALAVSAVGAQQAQRIIVVDDAASSTVRAAYEGALQALAWYGDSLLVAAGDRNAPAHIERGDRQGIRALGVTDAPIAWFYPSPDGDTFAFTQVREDGWHMASINANTELIADYGLMGSDGAGAQLPTPSLEVKSPMSVAWSPNGSKLAFGAGFEPPYVMKIVDLTTGDVAHTEFPVGYPGEMRWNSTGTQLAVSTYDPERTHHETWVVDATSGAGTHLMDGCIIVWSPDDRFLAVHGEDITGISIIDVTTGARFRLTEDQADTSLLWTD
jgi:hypothetical protein